MKHLLEAGPFTASDGEGRVLFEDAEVALRGGEALVLEGPSGGGKSTLLRLITGLAPDGGAGRRRLNGEEFRGATMPGWRSRVTLMAQDAPAVPGTVSDNLSLPYAFKAAGGRTFDRGRARELLTSVGLDRLPDDRDVRSLSGGERHRLALVRGLLWDPPVLLADEPLAGLDDETAAACFGLMLDFARRPNHALLVVLHHAELGDQADGRLRLRDGRVVAA